MSRLGVCMSVCLSVFLTLFVYVCLPLYFCRILSSSPPLPPSLSPASLISLFSPFLHSLSPSLFLFLSASSIPLLSFLLCSHVSLSIFHCFGTPMSVCTFVCLFPQSFRPPPFFFCHGEQLVYHHLKSRLQFFVPLLSRLFAYVVCIYKPNHLTRYLSHDVSCYSNSHSTNLHTRCMIAKSTLAATPSPLNPPIFSPSRPPQKKKTKKKQAVGGKMFGSRIFL